MKIAISQPTYLPWCGYFDLIDQVDTFVILDSVQFERRSWQHRNRIKTLAGLQWLTVPVRFHGHFGQLIHDVQIRDVQFAQKHLRAIELNYRRAKFFNDYFPQLEEFLSCDGTAQLVDLNLRILEWLCSVFSIPRKFLRSSKLAVKGKRTELLAGICLELGASEYISPLGSAEYLLAEMDVMTARSIEVAFQHYEHPEYRQLYPPFAPYASALDLLLNEGPNALEIIRSGRRPAYVPSQVALPQVAEA